MSILWEELDDKEYLAKAEQQIWLSAFANNNPRAPAHKEADNAYDEAIRRGKPWLYSRAHNNAVLSCGHDISDLDREMATEEGYRRREAERAEQNGTET
jgi:hypothetical protein